MSWHFLVCLLAHPKDARKEYEALQQQNNTLNSDLSELRKKMKQHSEKTDQLRARLDQLREQADAISKLIM